jgi:hypothetical protein
MKDKSTFYKTITVTTKCNVGENNKRHSNMLPFYGTFCLEH